MFCISKHQTLFKNLNLYQRLNFSSKFKGKIADLKNDHIIILQDQQSYLPYLSEVLISYSNAKESYKGLVLKTQQKKSYIGLYKPINSNQLTRSESLQIEILKNVRNVPQNIHTMIGSVIDCEFRQNYPKTEKNIPYIIYDTQLPELNQKQGQNIQSLSCLLTVCQDFKQGDMIIFQGGYKSGRTSQVESLIHSYTHKSPTKVSVYMNLSRNDSIRIAKNCKSLVFNQQNFTNTSAYSLCIKAIQTAKYLSRNLNFNVLLTIDGINDILVHEWTLLNNIQMSLSPISIVNELYSFSMPKSTKYKGSLTSIITVENYENTKSLSRDIQYIQQITMNSNNEKHLSTLNRSIKFPLDIRLNFNLNKSKTFKDRLRGYVNKLIQQKKQAYLKKQLKLDRDEPWEYYFILDSQWWVKGLKNYRPLSLAERDDFIGFLVWNIDREICSQWNKDASQIFKLFCKYCIDKSTSQRSIYISEEVFEEFLLHSKLNGLLNPFKKDYLP